MEYNNTIQYKGIWYPYCEVRIFTDTPHPETVYVSTQEPADLIADDINTPYSEAARVDSDIDFYLPEEELGTKPESEIAKIIEANW